MKFLFCYNAWSMPLCMKYDITQLSSKGLLAAVNPFEVIFDDFGTHFGLYLGHDMTDIGFYFHKRLRIACFNIIIRVTPEKNSEYSKLHALSGQLARQNLEIWHSGHVCRNKAIIGCVL